MNHVNDRTVGSLLSQDRFRVLSLPVHGFSWVSSAKKSVGKSKLEKVEVEFSIAVISLSNEFAALGFGGMDRFLGLFWTNPQETHSKVD